MTGYADTSFLASLYLPDTNSTEAARRMARLSLPVLITPLGGLELVNAMRLRQFRKEIGLSEIEVASAAFRTDLESGVFTMRSFRDEIFPRATELAGKYTARLGARSLDILHVAAAIDLGCNTFHTFDDRQRRLAKAAGLSVA